MTPPSSPSKRCERRSPPKHCPRKEKRCSSKERTATECPTSPPKCAPRKEKKCAFPAVAESPFAVFHVTGKWVCQVVDCKSSCTPGAQSVKYRIVLDEVNLEHADGGKVCEGWKWFTPCRYKSYFWKMCPQKLPFYPCELPAEPGCGC